MLSIVLWSLLVQLGAGLSCAQMLHEFAWVSHCTLCLHLLGCYCHKQPHSSLVTVHPGTVIEVCAPSSRNRAGTSQPEYMLEVWDAPEKCKIMSYNVPFSEGSDLQFCAFTWASFPSMG